MEFWGVEVKSGEPLEVDPGDGLVLRLTQACLGEVKDKGNESICLFVKVDEQKLVLGTLSYEKFPQISFDLMFEKKFELSHNWKSGSVYCAGFRAYYAPKEDESSDFDSEEDLPIIPHHSEKSELQAVQASKPGGTSAKQVKIVEPNKAEDADEDVDKDTTSDEDSSDEDDETGESDDSSEDEGSSEDKDEEIPSKAEASKKRPVEAPKKTPVPDKKAKFITPEKTDGNKAVVHVATPHPSKQAGTKQTPKPGGAFPCKSCNRSFSSETGLQSHTKAKHCAGK